MRLVARVPYGLPFLFLLAQAVAGGRGLSAQVHEPPPPLGPPTAPPDARR